MKNMQTDIGSTSLATLLGKSAKKGNKCHIRPSVLLPVFSFSHLLVKIVFTKDTKNMIACCPKMFSKNKRPLSEPF